MTIKPATFVRAVTTLFGEHWLGAAADRYAVSRRKLRRMAAGQEEIGPHGIWQDIEQDLRDTGNKIDAILEETIDL